MAALPLRDRVLVSSNDSCFSTFSKVGPIRPMWYKDWSQEGMKAAMKAVIESGMSIRQAAEKHNIPKSTLGDRISGRVLPGATSGPSCYLSGIEEEELVNFLCRVAQIGHGRTRSEVIGIVERVLASRGIMRSVSAGWWSSFISRHPKVALRTPATLSLARAAASDRDILDNYFDELECTLEENGLLDKPCLIFNMDETGMPLDPKPLKIVTQKGHKNPSQVSNGVKTQITVVGCVSAGGQCLPPMVIWNRKNLPPQLATGEVPGTIYGLSSKGWIDQELFKLWFANHFLRYAPPVRPILLLLDGHSSHYCPETIRYAAADQVIIFTLPPNTTHLSQPLDKGIFGPLKISWRKVCHNFIVKNPGTPVTKHNFSALFSDAWVQAMTPKNILSGFHTTGVYPPNRKAITLPGDDDKPRNLASDTGIAYIPLYTPVKRQISIRARAESSPTESNCTDIPLSDVESPLSDSDLASSPITDNFSAAAHHLSADSHLSDSHSSDSSSSMLYQPAVMQSSLGQFLTCPEVTRRRLPKSKSSLRVLTSSENLQRIEEKEKEKQRKADEKETRAKERQAKKLLKSQVKALSKAERIKFEKAFEEGYDITTNARYNLWLKTYHPDHSKSGMHFCPIKTLESILQRLMFSSLYIFALNVYYLCAEDIPAVKQRGGAISKPTKTRAKTCAASGGK